MALAGPAVPGAPPPGPPPTPPPPRGRFYQFMMDNAPIMGALVVVLIFVAIIASIFWPYAFTSDPDRLLLRQIADTTTARGLITFLVAVSTVAIAIILIVYVVSAAENGYKERFSLGKEVLTSLIGILGTIIGFYFGTQGDEARPATAAIPITAEMTIEPEKPTAGASVTLSFTIEGGQAPYKYSIMFVPDIGNVIEGEAEGGTIAEPFQVPDEYDVSRPLRILLEVTDDAGAVGAKSLRVEIAPAAPQEPAPSPPAPPPSPP